MAPVVDEALTICADVGLFDTSGNTDAGYVDVRTTIRPFDGSIFEHPTIQPAARYVAPYN